MKTTIILAILIVMAHSLSAEGASMNTKPALNAPAVSVKAGTRPYEMKGREENRVPLVDFEDLSGWTVEEFDGAQADFIRTSEQQMWGGYVGKIAYKGTSDQSKAILRPPVPIPIDEAFNSVAMWIYGNRWQWEPNPTTPAVYIAVLIKDASGEEQAVHLTQVQWKEWWLAHKKLNQAESNMSFSGIEISGMANTEERTIFLDSLYFYREILKPLSFEPRPARNLTLFPGQSQGLNGTGKGKLPFPTREETILPTNFSKNFKNNVEAAGDGSYVFKYNGDDCRLTYTYKPSADGLGGIIAEVNGVKVGNPMADGGVEFGNGNVPAAKLVESALKDGVLHLVFDAGDGQPSRRVEYNIRIWQKSLVIDAVCREGEATGFAFGEVHNVGNPRLVTIPYLNYGGNPKVLCAWEADKPVFVSVWGDWYRSNASTLWSSEVARADSAKINGGTRYLPKTDGKRNDLYERVFLTVSPIFEETLPTIANPPTPHGKTAGERLWQESWGPQDYQKEHERSKTMRSYGINKLTQCNHEITWRDGGESFTLRTVSAPGRGGDDALKEYIAKQKSLGWLSGLYTNYTDYAPVNENWDEDKIQLTPEGEWRAAWPRCYALKPSRAVEFDAEFAQNIQQKFGTNAAYTDVHTAVGPWQYCDFDARVPGAGTFAATFYAYGELLLNDQKTYGPIWSEGTYQCLYAGLAAGNYGLNYIGPDLSIEPLNVAFDLMKIHPLECDIGMPWTGGFFKHEGWQAPENIDASIDHFIAATIAYGHIGWLVEEEHGIRRTCRSYYMLQQLQKRYALEKPVKIEYADEQGKWLTASQAIANEEIKNNRLHVIYENGLQIWVNGSKDNWKLPSGLILPSWGYFAKDKSGRFTEYSALADGKRIDYVKSAEYEYLDGRDKPIIHNGLGAKGAIAVRRKNGLVEIINIYGNDEIGFRTQKPGRCIAYDADGRNLGDVPVKYAQDGMAWFTASDKARRYEFIQEGDISRKTTVIKFPKANVVPGERLNAAIALPEDAKSASIEIEGESKVSDIKIGANKHMSVPVEFPRSLKAGGRAWVRLSVQTESQANPVDYWYVLGTVQPFEIGLHELDGDKYKLDITNNLFGSPAPKINITAGEGFAVVQDKADPAVFAVRPPAGEQSDKLRVDVSYSGFNTSKEFPLAAYFHHPAVKMLTSKTDFSWGYAYRGSKELPGNSQGGLAESGAGLYPEELTSGGVLKKSIFMHPPWIGGTGYVYGLTDKIKIPDKPCEFRTFIGIKDGGALSDGVTFIGIAIDEQGTEHHLFKEHWDKKQWKEISADLTQFKGRTILLKLISDVGPKDDSTADWAAWAETRIVEKKPVIRVKVI